MLRRLRLVFVASGQVRLKWSIITHSKCDHGEAKKKKIEMHLWITKLPSSWNSEEQKLFEWSLDLKLSKVLVLMLFFFFFFSVYFSRYDNWSSGCWMMELNNNSASYCFLSILFNQIKWMKQLENERTPLLFTYRYIYIYAFLSRTQWQIKMTHEFYFISTSYRIFCERS